MPNQPRRLAAILFADMVGYTALMQKDESQAKTRLSKFRQVLQEQVPAFQGEIVHFYGDGCLALFDSPLDAATCATTLQEQFQEDPIIPVRVGLHSGTVTREADHVYGDAINLTSRIESLGIPDSILLSKKIRDELKNQPNFLMVSLGKFDFKNVEEPLEVFAMANEGLLVPKKEEIKGKLKPKKKKGQPIWAWALIVLLIGAGAWFLGKGRANSSTLPDEILQSRIAVIPYENLTNDTSLNVLGKLAANYITRNLINLGDTKVAQYENVLEHLALLQDQPEAFGKRTGVQHLIQGSYFQEGQELILESQIVDLQSGDIVYALPVIRGNKASPSNLINELGQRMAGYFAMSKADYFLNTAPSIKAFEAWESGMEHFGSDYERTEFYLTNAIQQDSQWVIPYMQLGAAFINQGKYSDADALIQLMKQRFKQMTRVELLGFDYLVALREGDQEKEFKVMQEAFAIDPLLFAVNYQMGQTALGLNRPQAIINAYAHLDPSTLAVDNQLKIWWFNVYGLALARMNRLEEAQRMINYIPKTVFPNYITRGFLFTIHDQRDSLEQLLTEMETNGASENQILRLMVKTARQYGVEGDTSQQRQWAQRAINRIQNRPENIPLEARRLAEGYYYAKDYINALPYYLEQAASGAPSWYQRMRLGTIHAKMGNQEAALAIIQQFQELENASIVNLGEREYAQALIYAALGQKEQAMQLIRQAFEAGYGFDFSWRYDHDYEFIPLQDYPPFLEFVKPKDGG